METDTSSSSRSRDPYCQYYGRKHGKRSRSAENEVAPIVKFLTAVIESHWLKIRRISWVNWLLLYHRRLFRPKILLYTFGFLIAASLLHKYANSPESSYLPDLDATDEDTSVEAGAAFAELYGLQLKSATVQLLTEYCDEFTLDGKSFRILGGSIHYFRVPPEYWLDRLQKLKAAGLNTVTTYVPWNAHEPQKGQFNFKGPFDLFKFIQLAKSLGLYVILRPGPYIGAEWEWGGLPYWLLKDGNMQVRSMYPGFTVAVRAYFSKLLPMIRNLQYSKGGPIIAVQIENEYGAYGRDRKYIAWLRDLMREKGIKELLFVSESIPSVKFARIPGLFTAINFREGGTRHLKALEQTQPNRPVFVAEFWPGQFDHWGEDHHVWASKQMELNLRAILDAGASLNFYMFHGGTNFGFMNGANRLSKGFYSASSRPGYQPVTTSYDYDAPLNEMGQTTDKYFAIQQLMTEYNPRFQLTLDATKLSNDARFVPTANKTAYGPIRNQEGLTLSDALKHFKPIKTRSLTTMESYNQGYGYIVYRHRVSEFGNIQFNVNIADRAVIIVNDNIFRIVQNTKEENMRRFFDVPCPIDTVSDLIILVENMGRVSSEYHPGTLDNERRGMIGTASINGIQLTDWSVYNLDFSSQQLAVIRDSPHWNTLSKNEDLYVYDYLMLPTFYRIRIPVDQLPATKDYHIDVKACYKGLVIMNDQNLGRYWSDVGPTTSVYCPAPVLQKVNGSVHELIIFETDRKGKTISFLNQAPEHPSGKRNGLCVLGETHCAKDTEALQPFEL